MQISKTSWHYRYLVYTGTPHWDIPDSLCQYARALVFRTLFLLVAVTIVAVICYAMAVAPVLWLIFGETFAPAACGGLVGWGAVVVTLIAAGIDRYQRGREHVVKPPNIAVEWIKAKKRKICPFIEFKE